MRVRSGGDSGPTLLLLHGLGATADVWNGVTALLDSAWPGRWLAPDLPGHGGSPALPVYTFETLATAMADLVDADTVVLGHSLGGAVGLTLAAGRRVRAVVGLGIKVAWTGEELARGEALAQRPVSWFASRAEAAGRYLRVAGLAGLIGPEDAAVGHGLVERDGRWRLAMDPLTFAVGAPDMPDLLARCGTQVLLARGEHDPMNTDAQLARLGVPSVTLAGLGHSAHVENPARTLSLVATLG